MVLAVGALLLSYAVAVLAWAVHRRMGPFAPVAAAVWGVGVAGCSALVFFEDNRILRALTFICGALVGLRVYSYCLAAAPQALMDHFRFLSVGMLSPHLVYALERQTDSRAALGPELLRLAVAAVAITGTWWLTMRLIFEGPGRDAWLINHLIVLVGFVIVMTAFGQVSFASWRLMGLRVRPVMDRIWLSRSPADFWRRWSWPIHLWLYRYVYRPCGGRYRAVVSVLAVFAVSGLMHEAIAFVALGQVTGHQSAFFAASAVGVLASPALEGLGQRGLLGSALARVVTLVFLAASAALMFVTIDAVIPLYAARSWVAW
jgi:hypothetical protein